MMRKKLMTGVIASALAASMALPTFAATNPNSVIDTTKKGTLTIHKLIENDGLNVEADGQVNAGESRLPVGNVEFSYVKIADLVNVAGKLDGTGETAVGMYYRPTDKFDAFVAAVGFTPTPIEIGGVKYYTTESVETIMKQALTTENEMAINSYVDANAGAQAFTAADGSLTFANMDLGLYVVAETDITFHDGIAGNSTSDANDTFKIEAIDAHGTTTEHTYAYGQVYHESVNPEAPVVETPAAPFMVSLPTTNTAVLNGDAAGSVWQYEVHVYPKNQTTSIFKRIIDPDEVDGAETLRTSEDYQIGDTIEQVIWADVPKLQANYLNGNNDASLPNDLQDNNIADTVNKHTVYKIKDTITDGWTFDTVTKVVIGPRLGQANVNGNNYNTYIPTKANEFDTFTTVLTLGTDYTVVFDANDPHEFEVVFLTDGLAKLDALTEDAQVAVFFESTLNEDAKIGQVIQNMNYPTLTWKNTNTSERAICGNEIYAYTYQLDIKKEGVVDATNVKFVVSRTDTNDIAQAAEKDLTDTVSDLTFLNQDDSIQFVQEAAGIYHVYDAHHDAADSVEVTTINRVDYYTLTPDNTGKLTIKGLDSNTYTFKEVQTEDENNLLKSTFDVEIKAADDAAASLRDGIIASAKVSTEIGDDVDITIGVIDANMSTPNTKNNGIASMQVNNYDAVDLRTGGTGRYMITSVGIVMMVAICAVVVGKKKREENI